LPESRAQILALEYEEARILAFAGGFFQPSKADVEILDRLDCNNLILIGGGQQYIPNAGDVICGNKGYKFFNRRVRFDVIAAIPPIPISGSEAFWHEFQGADCTFYFGLCRYCGTVIAFNVAS
jgi:hypothetical protein